MGIQKEEQEKPQVRDLRNGDWYWTNKQILQNKDINSSDKLTYQALAYFASNTQQKCFPSIPTLEELTGLTRPTIIKSIRRLEGIKVIEVEREQGRVSVYYLLKINQLKLFTGKNKTRHQLKKDTTPVKISPSNNTKEQDLYNKKLDINKLKRLNEMKKGILKKTSI